MSFSFGTRPYSVEVAPSTGTDENCGDFSLFKAYLSSSLSGQIRAESEGEEAFKSFTEVKVLIQHCENTPLQVKVLLSKAIRSSVQVKSAKRPSSVKSKSTQCSLSSV